MRGSACFGAVWWSELCTQSDTNALKSFKCSAAVTNARLWCRPSRCTPCPRASALMTGLYANRSARCSHANHLHARSRCSLHCLGSQALVSANPKANTVEKSNLILLTHTYLQRERQRARQEAEREAKEKAAEEKRAVQVQPAIEMVSDNQQQR